ncbi:MAG: PAS domain S-box protein [Armatimonadetes bacterium]|nr:PAS domain S-box protein [Armatimonadota bacterium]
MADSEGTPLSLRERQLLKLASSGFTDTAIGNRLGISEATVKTYWRRIRMKLGKNSRTELVAHVLKEEMDRAMADVQANAHRQHPDNETLFCQMLIEHSPEAVLIVLPDTTVFMANDKAGDLFGWGPEDLVGKPISDLLPRRYRPDHAEHVKGFFEHPRTKEMGDHFATFGLHRSGKEIPVAANLSVLGTGERMVALCTVRAMTLLK